MFNISGTEILVKFLYTPIGTASAFILVGISDFIGWLIIKELKKALLQEE